MSETTAKRPNQGKVARDLNDSIRYTMWSVFHLQTQLEDADREAEAGEVDKLFDEMSADVTVRGVYDVSALRADAELMIWSHAESSDDLQQLYHRLRRTAFGARLAVRAVRQSRARWRGDQNRRCRAPRADVPRSGAGVRG